MRQKESKKSNNPINPNSAAQGVDYVFNAAVIKHVPISEYNPMEAIRVNIIGLENIIQGSLNYNVQKLIQQQ